MTIRDSPEIDEINRHPFELSLLLLIARRARRTHEFNTKGLSVGEALVGDFERCGLTRQQYRTSLKKLKKWGFITTKSTNKGTIATLINSDVYDINAEDSNQQTNHSSTSKQPAANHQLTTNKNVKKEKNGKNEKKTYGEFVQLTEKEHGRLLEDFGSKNLHLMLEKLNNYLGADKKRLKKYTSHNHVLRGWVAEGLGITKTVPGGQVTCKCGQMLKEHEIKNNTCPVCGGGVLTSV